MNAEHRQWRDDATAADISGTVDLPDAASRARRRLILIASAIAIVVIAVVWVAMRGGGTKPAAAPVRPAVTVIVPGRTAVADTITATGTLSAKRDMPVGVAGEGGMVSRVLVDAGDWVRAGQVMAIVDPRVQAAQTGQTQAQVSAAEADAKLAQAQLDRAQRLVGRGFISKADIDQRTATRDGARARVRLARAQYAEMTARLGRLAVRAPASGLVLTRAIEPGQIVSSGSQALFRVAMDGQLELRARLAEQDLASIHVGEPADVTPVGAPRRFVGRVWQVSPVIDPQTRQGEARVQLAYARDLRPGGFATARFAGAQTEKPVLPESALMSDATGANFVYVVTPGDRIEKRAVTIGDITDAGIAVLSGLSGTERVVLSAGAFLNPGDLVAPQRRRA